MVLMMVVISDGNGGSDDSDCADGSAGSDDSNGANGSGNSESLRDNGHHDDGRNSHDGDADVWGHE
jgi:hypothetical protein